MPPRKNRNARSPASNTPNTYSRPLFPEFDSPGQALPITDLPPFDIDQLRSDPEPEIERAADDDLIDIHGTSGRIRGDCDTPSPLIPASPLVVPFRVPEEPTLPSAGDDQTEAGHVRSPILAREPTMLESFSRTVRNYVPSSIPIPAASPAPPRVSRPLSAGSFMPSALLSTSPASPSSATSKRRGSSGSGMGITTNDWRARNVGQFGVAGLDDVFGSDEEDGVVGEALSHNTRVSSNTSYPGAADGDPILWSRWDVLRDENVKRLLFLGYSTGLQIWDCTNLGSVVEVLNLSRSDWGRVTFAGVLPPPPPSTLDPFASERPLIGIATRTRDESSFIAYSLSLHQVVKSIIFPGYLDSFSPNDRFIIICTTNAPSLHILSSTSFETLHRIPSASLVPFGSPASLKPITNIVSVSDIDADDATSHARPIFSLSHRLLAFASTRPRSDLPSRSSTAQPRIPSSMGTLGISQADLGTAAMKVGGSVLTGMKSLGEMAYSAAKSRVGPGYLDQRPVMPSSSTSGLSNLFFSRSAPAANASGHPRRGSITSLTHGGGSYPKSAGSAEPLIEPVYTASLHSPSPSNPSSGYHVTIVDLMPLLTLPSSHPTVISEFAVSKRQPISNLGFTKDGNSLIVSTEDGRVIRVFQIRPIPSVLRSVRVGSPSEDTGLATAEPWHMYNLRRGRTSAIIEGLDASDDGRWIAVGTRRHTVHVFAVNPYGGKPDNKSHSEGRVQNTTELPLSTEVTPLVRLRVAKSALPEHSSVPLSFIFVPPFDADLPTNLLPPPTNSASAPPSVHSSPVKHPGPLSPHRARRPSNYQDVLVFDPADGSLSLRRFTIEIRPRDQALPFPGSVTSLGGTSIPLPGVSPPNRLSISPPNPSGRPSGLSQTIDGPLELIGRDNIVASWSLKRGRDWREIRRSLRVNSQPHAASSSSSSLANAELSTSSPSHRILPRSVYLSHQFSFYALGEDYHALIRRFHLDIGGCKIEVRREVQISAYSAGTGESFVEGFSTPLHLRRVSSSFDEPLASALSAGLDYTHPSRTIIPMLPNGTPGSRPKSFKNSVPIRNMATGLGDGVSEGLGRIRREMHKVRSPHLGPRPDVSGSVPLEFDEEDEDFLSPDNRLGMHGDGTISRSTSRGEGDSGASVSTPSTSAVPLDDEADDLWHGWNAEDKLIVDEAEQFDDVVGFLDEEQTPRIRAERTERSRRRAM